MAHYGELLEAFEPEKDSMYAAFDTYFNHPTMVKIKDVNVYSMYMSKTYCLLTNECRYIIAFIQKDSNPIKTQERFSDLKWVSLQTRTLKEQHTLPPHGYQPHSKGPLNVAITRIKVTEAESTYSCDKLPLKCTLLHTKPGKREYNDNGNIIAALETYQTILVLDEK